jgi:hypothetical protein
MRVDEIMFFGRFCIKIKMTAFFINAHQTLVFYLSGKIFSTENVPSAHHGLNTYKDAFQLTVLCLLFSCGGKHNLDLDSGGFGARPLVKAKYN